MRSTACVAVAVAMAACSSSTPAPEVAAVSPVDAAVSSVDAPAAPVNVALSPVPSPVMLPEKGPHPEYPTPRGSGTDDLFLLEEPDRGPHLTSVKLPDRDGLRFRQATHCEVVETGIICGPVDKNPRWRVGSRDGRVALAERLDAGGAVAESIVFWWAADGGLATQVFVDGYGALARARMFNLPGRRYTERLLDGANGLAGCGMMAVKRDAAGHAVESACLQWSGEPMRDTNGVAATRFRHDKTGFVVGASRHGPDGSPALGHDGVHRATYERDAAGRVVAERRFDLDGQPVRSLADGCAVATHAYDERGLEHVSGCLLPDGTGIPLADGVTRTVWRLDATGCRVERATSGSDGARVRHSGIYTVRLENDPHCAPLRWSCFGAQDEPVACGVGEPVAYRNVRDERGRIVSTKSYAANGGPGRDAEYNVFEVRQAHDDLGNVTDVSCWGPAGEPLECSRTGFHRQTESFDAAGRSQEVRFFDANGQPTSNQGVWRRRYVHDNYDHVREVRGLDLDGNLVDPVGTVKRLYDAGHRLFGLQLLDRNGAPASYRGCYVGRDCPNVPWQAVRIVRGANGNPVKNLYFDAEGQLIGTIACASQRCWR